MYSPLYIHVTIRNLCRAGNYLRINNNQHSMDHTTVLLLSWNIKSYPYFSKSPPSELVSVTVIMAQWNITLLIRQLETWTTLTAGGGLYLSLSRAWMDRSLTPNVGVLNSLPRRSPVAVKQYILYFYSSLFIIVHFIIVYTQGIQSLVYKPGSKYCSAFMWR